MNKRNFFKHCLCLLLVAIAFAIPVRVADAAKKPKLSKTTLTFSSDSAKAQTITIKNLKTSNVKKLTVTNDWKLWIDVKKKGKNKIVIKPKRSGKVTYGVGVRIEYKKPVNGSYSEWLSFKKIQIKGSSKIPIKTAKDLCAIRGSSYSVHKWQYYLANDINMTGKGIVKDEYGSKAFVDIYLDGKGHKIISDTPVFQTLGGTIKNVTFESNYNCTVSKNDAITKIWSDYYVVNAGIAPIINFTGGTISGCKATGKMVINYDKDVTWMPVGGTDPSNASEIRVGGLVGENGNSSVITGCKSDVDINITFGKDQNHFTYVGGIASLNYGYSGNKQYATISESMFSGNILINDNYSFAYAGAICGQNNANIADCLNIGSVKVRCNDQVNTIGGACGMGAIGGSASVKRVLTAGDVDFGLYGSSVSDSSIANNTIPKFENAYYLKSKSEGFNYMQNAFAVSGVKGIEDAELTSEATFAGFDFGKVWVMTAEGPRLRNVAK